MSQNRDNLRRLFLVLLILLAYKESEAQNKVLEVGEELKYEVSFGFIKLGFLKYNLTAFRREGRDSVYNARLEIKTYPEVPFIKLNDILETEMYNKHSNLYTGEFYETNFRDRSISRTDCKFDYAKSKVKMRTETDGVLKKDINEKFDEDLRICDELTWQYDARINSFSNKNYIVPVFSNGEISSVRYSFNHNKSVMKLDMLPYEISVIKVEGTADYTGFFGFTGEFLILLSDDEERVPLKAYFNSTLGNVVLELISYKKSKWSPPAFLK